MQALACPICQRPVPPRAENRVFPFCSARCQTIDLGAWLTEDYRVPTGADETERDGPGEDEVRGGRGSGDTDVH